MKMKTDWDYSERAHTYDCRADYSEKAILNLLNTVKLYPGEKFQNIINEISNLLTMESYMVPYSTKIWFAIKRN